MGLFRMKCPRTAKVPDVWLQLQQDCTHEELIVVLNEFFSIRPLRGNTTELPSCWDDAGARSTARRHFHVRWRAPERWDT